MRGSDDRSCRLFSYMAFGSWVGKDHPMRVIRGIVNARLGPQ